MSDLDWDKDQALIIGRVLDYGLLEDWKILRKKYGDDRIIAVSTRLRSLDKVTVAFLCALYGLEKKDFRCYNMRQSYPGFWEY